MKNTTKITPREITKRESVTTQDDTVQTDVRSHYLVDRLFNTPDDNLFNYVKFNLVNDKLDKYFDFNPRIMDIGCGLQVAKRYLQSFNANLKYRGADYEASFKPDYVVDLNKKNTLNEPMNWRPHVVMLLDVLEHLHEEKQDLDLVLANIVQQVPSNSVVIITLPQWYRLDCFKLPHLHYPEHKIRLTQNEWRQLISNHFEIIETQGLGYLSVLPYLPMALKSFRVDNKLGALYLHLRNKTMEQRWLKPIDLFFSRTLGKLPFFNKLSNDILFVAKVLPCSVEKGGL
jgi:hypothetical protein